MSLTADPDDPGDVRPTDPRRRQLTDLRAANQAALARLQREGMQVSLAGLRLEVLLDSIFTPEDRITFELAYEGKIETFLEEARKKLVRAKLTQGVPKGASVSAPPPVPGLGPRPAPQR